MKTFTVLTVSKRTGWEKDALAQISKQTVQPDKWIVVGEDNVQKGYGVFVPAPPLKRFSNLNASLNKGLSKITTDYVIFYQDFIELKEDCFEKLLNLADSETLVTTCTPNYDGSDDGRYTGVDIPRVCRPDEWETNVACAPMGVLKDIGGFEEDLDWGWSWDNVLVAEKAAMLGCKFILDESNRPKLLPHEQTSKLEFELNADRCEEILRDIRLGRRKINAGYL